MRHEKWALYLGAEHKSEGNEGSQSPSDVALQRRFVDLFERHLSPPARVLAPGAVSDAALLAERGYEVHSLVIAKGNLKWFEQHKSGRVFMREHDAHDLDYPADFFDGYFTVQVHEHWISPYVHVGEVRYCMRDWGVVFVDACGTTNPDMRQIWHTNLVPEQQVKEQWEYWGFKERWRGSSGDERPQFVFEKLPIGHPEFKNSSYVEGIMRARGELS